MASRVHVTWPDTSQGESELARQGCPGGWWCSLPRRTTSSASLMWHMWHAQEAGYVAHPLQEGATSPAPWACDMHIAHCVTCLTNIVCFTSTSQGESELARLGCPGGWWCSQPIAGGEAVWGEGEEEVESWDAFWSFYILEEKRHEKKGNTILFYRKMSTRHWTLS